jgi:3',5'-cyclic AMP phosphodiesterase CpdA
MKLWAISDLHLGVMANRQGLRDLPAHPSDWLILAGDICESTELLIEAFTLCTQKFAKVFWVPGNHELWLVDRRRDVMTSPMKYAELVQAARRLGVVTPEDPWVVFPPTGEVIVPLFTLYDYSFRPDHVSREGVIAWAAEIDNVCSDEVAIKPGAMQTMDQWNATLCDAAEARFERELAPQARTILVSHFPLREDLVRIPRVPRFTPWCGTRRTHDWHVRYRAVVAISGHLHVRHTDWRDGVRFEEVSLGYVRQWDPAKGLQHYLRLVCDARY